MQVGAITVHDPTINMIPESMAFFGASVSCKSRIRHHFDFPFTNDKVGLTTSNLLVAARMLTGCPSTGKTTCPSPKDAGLQKRVTM